MSLLREVIDIVSENDITNARATLKKLLKELRSFEGDTRSYVQENYEEYSSALVNNDLYLEQAEHLTVEVNNLIENIENETKTDLLAIAEDVQQYFTELEELRIGLRINQRLLKIDSLFGQLEEAKSTYEFIHIRKIINDLKETINNPQDEDIFKRLACYKNIKIRWHVENELLLNTLQTQFDTLVQLTEKTFQNTKAATLKISNDNATLKDIVVMLFNSNFNIQRMCKFLMDNVFEPIITKPVCLQYNEDDGAEFSKLTLSFSLKPIVVQAENLNLRPSYAVVFGNIRKVFQCLKPLNIFFSDELCVYRIIAENIREQFFKVLVNDCLTYSIPETMDDMNASTLTRDIEDLHNFLVSISFLGEDEDDMKLREFSERVNVIFKKRFCLNIQKNAIQIMHKDLHEMQLIDEAASGGSFPSCMVSKNTLELIELMENVLKEASEPNGRPPTNGGGKAIDAYVHDDIHDRLCSTIPMILERYLTEVVNTHEKILKTIPQQTALFHNNCMYLAWWFSKSQEPDTVDMDRCNTIVLELQELGSKHFASQIKKQRSQLMEILREFGKYFIFIYFYSVV